MYKRFFKRVVDFCISLVMLFILFIPLLVISIWLYLVNKGAGAFFLQERVGKGGKIFKVIKFKTMTDEKDEHGYLLPDADRMTKIGNFIRASSIDELPQIINVFKGDMALIGPRPMPIRYLPLFTKEQARRHEVRPGISGWAQVNGRNYAKLSQKFANDVWYVDHCTFAIDIKIIWMTINNVLHGSDVGAGAEDMGNVDDLNFFIRIMKFGSDYNLISDYKKGRSLPDFYPNSNFYACGRQAINDLIYKNHWKKIWIPSYFCYDVVNYIKNTGIEIVYYTDYPGYNDTESISKIVFQEGDVLLRSNFFGLRSFRSNSNIKVPVIEDHSYDMIGDWALKSDADYCVASIRKSIPVSEGGILWSPLKKELPIAPKDTEGNKKLAALRYEGMKEKTEFLEGIRKNVKYRKKLLDSRDMFDNIEISKISDDSWDMLTELDVQDWYNRTHHNWELLQGVETGDVKILQPENDSCNPFSLILLFKSKKLRDKIRDVLINRQTVFPAILWRIPEDQNSESVDFGNRMLSIHCDGRFDKDLEELKERIDIAIQLMKEQC